MEELTCKICGATKEWVEPGMRKDGTNYDGFYGCPNYRNHPKQPERGGYQRSITPQKPGEALIMEELVSFRKEINERLDAMAEYLSKRGIE